MESNKEEIVIGIDLGKANSCAAIMRNGNVKVIPENLEEIKSYPSIVCFKIKSDCLIGTHSKNNMLENPESTIFDRKGLLDHKFSNQYIQKDIKNYHVKIIEDPTS